MDAAKAGFFLECALCIILLYMFGLTVTDCLFGGGKVFLNCYLSVIYLFTAY